jgi:hypothetical protein
MHARRGSVLKIGGVRFPTGYSVVQAMVLCATPLDKVLKFLLS